MIDDIVIPPEALLAARQAFVNAGTSDDDRDPFAEACLAMLRAWPGANWDEAHTIGIILPLPQEASDE